MKIGSNISCPHNEITVWSIETHMSSQVPPPPNYSQVMSCLDKQNNPPNYSEFILSKSKRKSSSNLNENMRIESLDNP